ncbi:MAG: aminotransferase class I/II-fold pyridoxal phosphate-dependent enzyme [Deltaproteobacteria bacterium]|nr:aminotransferase class I/II-fold pyridoxal phosphate-dependent enzyme [Deltaproteobacteria bacterium]
MELSDSLAERIRTLKAVAASMHEGAIHTELIPEIDKILALPDRLDQAAIGEREAVARQVREYEQTFDRLGYTLLDQVMPPTGVSGVFRIVAARDAFRKRLRQRVEHTLTLEDGTPVEIDKHTYKTLSEYSLSIGTPPVTKAMRQLVWQTLFGGEYHDLLQELEVLRCDRLRLFELLEMIKELINSSMHYCTAAEEQRFLRDAAEFPNFEGGRLFNRVVLTESPARVIELIERHVFDKFSSRQVRAQSATPADRMSAVRVVEPIDALNQQLLEQMEAEPNKVFVVRVTAIPHRIFEQDDGRWLHVIGRLMLIDYSTPAQRSNTTIVYTLFPHVARTLRNIQTSFAGRPANTQLHLRLILERFSAEALQRIIDAHDQRIERLNAEETGALSLEAVRSQEWTRSGLKELMTLTKLRRMLCFLRDLADGKVDQLSQALHDDVTAKWMRYFYSGLPTDPTEADEVYRATVVPGGGRGSLTLIGEYHRQRTRDDAQRFRETQLSQCRQRLEELKGRLQIPESSTDEIEAAIAQSQLRALSPTQWQGGEDKDASLLEHTARTMVYRAADTAQRLAGRARDRLERAAFGNLTGRAAALVKRAMSDTGFSALHGRLEDTVGERVGFYDRRIRDVLSPIQDLVKQAQRSLTDIKGELDPTSVSEIEAVLNLIEQGYFYPTLLLPELSWTYNDVFPERDFPTYCTIRIALNEQFEIDPLALLQRLEALRYLFRRFPEVFDLLCRTMLLVVNSPHNPTGVVYRRETQLRLLQIAAEYGIAVIDDNAYHKIVTKQHKAREGDRCLAQIYQAHRRQFKRPVRLYTVGATTKGLQGAGDRTGLLVTSDQQAIEFVRTHASAPHYVSLYLTQLKLESGLTLKRYTRQLELMASAMLDPTTAASPWHRLSTLLSEELNHCADETFSSVAFLSLLDGYEELLRLKQRGATVRHLSAAASAMVSRIKRLRLEKQLREDVEKRLDQTRLALLRASGQGEQLTFIEPQGAFYFCVKLCDAQDTRGVQDFLEAIAEQRGIDFTYAGAGYVRGSLGGPIDGDKHSYDRLGLTVETFTRLLFEYWQRFDEANRELSALPQILGDGDQALARAAIDMEPLIASRPQQAANGNGVPINHSERGVIFAIEEGRSRTDKIFVDVDQVCESVDEMLASRTFRVIYRRLLRRTHQQLSQLADLSWDQIENAYGPLSCQTAYHDRQRIDATFSAIIAKLYRAWHGADTARVLTATVHAKTYAEKSAVITGIGTKIHNLINELYHVFCGPLQTDQPESAFDVGYEVLRGVEPAAGSPLYLDQIIRRCPFAGATTALASAPHCTTGASKRVADYRYGFIRRDASDDDSGRVAPPLAYFRARLQTFPQTAEPEDYVCKAVQVGPFRMLLTVHRAYFHLISDELRLFPQIADVQLSKNLNQSRFDGVLLFGVPMRLMGDDYRTGYIIDSYEDGHLLPTAWVTREDATDYVGFLKKSLLTLHNERVVAMGGFPVHGAMITITFKNGLRKTLVFSADSGTGKSETITAMMEQMISGDRIASELDRIDILAGDMLSLWRGEDGQLYAFGTETGDFMRLTDITETWKQRFGDLLNRGNFSNLDHPKNPRVTIPGICLRAGVLSPTRVNGFFYINNYQAAPKGAVEIVEDPHQLLKQVLVRGLRKNKGTSGDQPSLRAGLEFAGKTDLVVRYRHDLDRLLDWQPRLVGQREQTCLCFRDGGGDVYAAREAVRDAFRGQRINVGDSVETIASVEYSVMNNLFFVTLAGRRKLPLSREIYDQVYEPLVSTFCGNPFVDPRGMNPALGVFAEAMHRARVHTGIIYTQLARPGYEHRGPAKAACDVVDFLLQDEEVAARFQRNKRKVQQAMTRTYPGVLRAGSNLPTELEGYNLLLLEEHESTQVAFVDGNRTFNIPTPYYQPASSAGAGNEPFVPAIALPEHLATIADICQNPDYERRFVDRDVSLERFSALTYWRSIEALTYQVLLLNGVITLGSSESEIARFPVEVRKARKIAERIAATRQPIIGGDVVPFQARANR